MKENISQRLKKIAWYQIVLILFTGLCTSGVYADAGSDIIGTKLILSSPLEAGSEVILTDFIRNQGNSDALPFEIEYYLISDPVSPDLHTRLGSWQVNGLKAGAAKNGEITLAVPDIVPSGEYYLMRYIDRAVVLSSEYTQNNRQRSSQVFTVINNNVSDLYGIGTVAPSNAAAGEYIPVTLFIGNNGENEIGPSSIYLFLSHTDTPDASAVLIGSITLPSVAAGSESEVEISAFIPLDISAGNYYLITSFVSKDELIADTKREYFWYNEDPLIITTSLSPDVTPDIPGYLPVDSPVDSPLNPVYQPNPNEVDVVGLETIIPAEAFIGDSIKIVDSMMNIGGAPANIVRVTYSLSPNTDGTNSRHIGWWTTMNLLAGETRTEPRLLGVPSGMTPGLYYLTKTITVTAASPEINNGNNWWVSNHPVYIRYNPKDPIPDLTHVQTIWPSGQPGETVQITDTITNIGKSCVSDVAVAYYLSPYPEFDEATSYYLGVWWVDSVCSREQKTNTTEVVIPADLRNGEYYIYSIIDPCSFLGECDEGIPELDKSNNINMGRLIIGPCVFC